MNYKKTVAGSLFFIPAFALGQSSFIDSFTGSALGSILGTTLTNDCRPQRVYLVERPVIRTTVITKKRSSFTENKLKTENTRLKVANDTLLDELCKMEEMIGRQKEQLHEQNREIEKLTQTVAHSKKK